MTVDLDERDRPPSDASDTLLDLLPGHVQRGRRFRRALLPSLGIAAALALVGLNVLVFGRLVHVLRAGGAPAAHTIARKSAAPAPTHNARSRKPTKPAAAPAPITVRLTAARNDSWVEIRANSATGRVLYDGVVSQGDSVHVRGRRFWARFGAIGNFDLTIDGRPVHPTLSGTVDAIIGLTTVRPASSSPTS